MDNLSRWFKNKWLWIATTMGLVVLTISSIFVSKKIQKSDAVDDHKLRVDSLRRAKNSEQEIREKIEILEAKAEEQKEKIEEEKKIAIEAYVQLEQEDITQQVADKFGFLNGDKK